jgi:hypothetical protein
VKVIACIQDPIVIDKILNHLKAKEATQLPHPPNCHHNGTKPEGIQTDFVI